MPLPARFEIKQYDTRLDRFRASENIGIAQWADEAAMSRTQLNHYRTGEDQPRSNTLADLVRAASRILGRPVNASELYDLGEDTPVAKRTLRARTNRTVRGNYDSRLDKLLRRRNVPLKPLAEMSRLTRQTIRQLRMDVTYPVVPTIRSIVAALRRMGHAVVASDIIDVGED